VLLLVGLLAVVAAATVAVVLLLSGHWSSEATGPQPTSSAPAPPSASAPPLTEERAEQFSTALASGDEASFRSVVALPQEQALDPGALQAFADPVDFDLATFSPIDGTTATVEATVRSGTPESFVVYLLREGDEWLIVATAPTS
jgi:FlaG/FlaF family flagellin (archaellin)